MLDSVPFAQFKKCWEHNLCKYNNTHSGHPLNKIDFLDVFVPSWNQAMVPKDIISGFRHTGIYPFNPSAIPKTAMAPSLVTDKENGEGRLVLNFIRLYLRIHWIFLFMFLKREQAHILSVIVHV